MEATVHITAAAQIIPLYSPFGASVLQLIY